MIRFLRKAFFIFIVVLVIVLIAAQVTVSFFLKNVLEREASRLLRVPVYIERAGTNLFGGDFWMKGVRIKNASGFQEPDFLTARTIAVDINMLSFLTNEFAVHRVLLKDPEITVEVNEAGEVNAREVISPVLEQTERLANAHPKLLRMKVRYVLEKFAVRNGAVRFVHPNQSERDWGLKSLSFSLARVVYPPDPEEALPAALYVNATIPGASEGKVLILGRFNPFVAKKSFDITGSAKGLTFHPYNVLQPNFPLTFSEGTLQLKLKALCHENQADILHHVRVENLKLQMKSLTSSGKAPLAFGFPAETIAHFFNDIKPVAEPFDFEFRVTGDLGDPKFDLFRTVNDEMQKVIHDRLSAELKRIEERAKEILPSEAAS